MNSKNLYLENKKSKILLFTISFLFFFSINFISAIATLSNIPDANMQYGDFFQFNIYDYGTNINQNSIIVQYLNPDNQSLMRIFGDVNGEQTNSYFTIRLINGEVSILSNFKSLTIPVTIYVADVPFQSQTSDIFNINIQSSQTPIQIASIADVQLNGNQTISLDITSFFTNFNQLKVNYEDNTLMETVQIVSGCISGDFKICITNNRFIEITGLNKTVSDRVLITAINNYGETSDINGGFYVTATLQNSSFSFVPQRLPFDMAGFPTLTYNSTGTINLNLFWGNFTNINLTFFNNDSQINQTIHRGERVNTTPFDIEITNGSNVILYSHFLNYNSNNNITTIEVCNTVGCSTELGKTGERVIGSVPLQVMSIADFRMGYNDRKVFDIANFFYDFTTYNITFPNPDSLGDNITLQGSFLISDDSFASSTLGADLTKARTIIFTSGQVSYITPIFISVCNPAGCENSSENIFYVNVSGTGVIDTSTLIGKSTNYFIGLFPNASNLSFFQKTGTVIITMVIASILIFALGFLVTAGSFSSAILLIVGFIDALLFLFFVSISYISTSILIVITLILVLLLVAKFKGGSG